VIEVSSVKIESDEDGWHLIVHAETGDRESYDFRVHGCAEELVEQVKRIGAWLSEGEREAAAYSPPPSEDDLDAYEANDPKRISLIRQMDRRPW
jgi:hypothetical protein